MELLDPDPQRWFLVFTYSFDKDPGRATWYRRLGNVSTLVRYITYHIQSVP